MGRDNEAISKHVTVNWESAEKESTDASTTDSVLLWPLLCLPLSSFSSSGLQIVLQGSILGSPLCFCTRTLSSTVPSSPWASSVTSWCRNPKPTPNAALPITHLTYPKLYRPLSPFSTAHKQLSILKTHKSYRPPEFSIDIVSSIPLPITGLRPGLILSPVSQGPRYSHGTIPQNHQYLHLPLSGIQGSGTPDPTDLPASLPTISQYFSSRQSICPRLFSEPLLTAFLLPGVLSPCPQTHILESISVINKYQRWQYHAAIQTDGKAMQQTGWNVCEIVLYNKSKI